LVHRLQAICPHWHGVICNESFLLMNAIRYKPASCYNIIAALHGKQQQLDASPHHDYRCLTILAIVATANIIIS
jgi:hypothetical protein